MTLGNKHLRLLCCHLVCIIFTKGARLQSDRQIEDLYHETPMAFTVGQNAHVRMGSDLTLHYNMVIVHRGAGSLSSGMFTCQFAGIYKFQAYSNIKFDVRIGFEMYKNNVLVVSLYGHYPSDYLDSGNAVILKLAQGDTVYVKSGDLYSATLYGTPNQIYTTFTGVRMNPQPFHDHPFFDDRPAFSVAFDHKEDVPPSSPLTYNKVLLNINNDYNIHTGSYTVPVSGLYIFHFFSLSQLNGTLFQDLYHDQHYVCSIYGKNEDAGNTAILHLNAGNKVRVVTRQPYWNSICGAADQVYSTLSGALIADESTFLFNRDNVQSEKRQLPGVNVKVTIEGRRSDSVWSYRDNVQSEQTSYSGSRVKVTVQGRRSNCVPVHNLLLDGRIFVLANDYRIKLMCRVNEPAAWCDDKEYAAFSAGLTAGYTVSGDAEVVFNHVFVNVGNHYNPRTGKFTAYTPGIYEFNYHALSEKSSALWLELFHNSKYVISLNSHASSGRAAGGNAAVLELNSNDEVYIKVHSGRTNALFGRVDQIYCTFSGHLVAQSFSYANIIG